MMTSPFSTHMGAFSVAGLSVRTRNSDEMNPATARIGDLWERFFSQSWERSLPARGAADDRIFGVYSGYESNEHGAFDVTAGVAVPPPITPVAGAVQVNVQAGHYLVFVGQGEMPQTVIEAWKDVWRYFAQNPHVKRRFGTDFEVYTGPDKVAIHIGVLD
ncbi:GyrI-like domain-containing protein [Acidovorax radicis]|jgi:predicted transcriptional regulator YdeE|uniref:GyrI-like domain-containing protein n=1 Tax=Acidovorax radicis TaxID=758826 RepID=UPI001CF9A908|nr:GyrI-like domain-containing protein [Acidovorax radicis]UCU99484.1 GyrI-like domain-containing protein [Acidovorax radicis]